MEPCRNQSMISCFLPALLKLLTRLAEWLYLAWTLRRTDIFATLLSKIDERGTVKKKTQVEPVFANEMKVTKVFVHQLYNDFIYDCVKHAVGKY